MKFRQLFRRSTNEPPSGRGPHMTWAGRSLSQSVSRAGVFFRKQVWVWPIVAVVVLSLAGLVVRHAIETTIRGNLTSGLQTLVNVEAAMLDSYFKIQKSTAETLANDSHVRQIAYKLLQVEQASINASPAEPNHGEQVPVDASQAGNGQAGNSQAANREAGDWPIRNGRTAIALDSNGRASTLAMDGQQLAKELAPAINSHDYAGFFLADRTKTIVASSNAVMIGQSQIAAYDELLNSVLDGETVITPPFASVVMIETADGEKRMGVPTMFVAAPIRDASFQVVGALALRIRPEQEFTRILQFGRVGETGETYAFNAQGLMVSNSRFDESMILLGLLPDRDGTASILNITLRDPGGDMTAGFRPGVRRRELPLTKMAAKAIAGNSGVDVEGYRDYRGVMVVGAWQWLPEYGLGVATEVDMAQAFKPLVILRRVFWTLYAMLIASSIAIFVFTLLVARARREAQKAVVEARQLGQYSLDEEIGTGAMGVVYRGHHAMLRRPTAIKMLNTEQVDENALSRFEREVKITCKLTHPNTIAIYDYGRTPEGVFYYAMEYIEGIDLQSLVAEYGPQPESRVVHLLLQMCGSLFEAHSLGLVHRDVKPANTMLCRRGCEPDVIKVLDFGLVKTLEEDPKASGGGLKGTPLYMSPEAIQSPLSVDSRSDLYAVGAVGYYLLTGRTVFDAESIVELCQMQIEEIPEPPSRHAEQSISTQLEDAIMACLAKSRAKRPQTARDLAKLLLKCPTAHQWTSDEADAWWGRHERNDRRPGNGSQTRGPRTSGPQTRGPSSETSFDQTIDG
jgi:serine/threonine protein kinase